MFIATDKETGAMVTRMSPEWTSDFEGMRSRALAGLFMCPLCRQVLLFRRQNDRCGSHFAHKPNSQCPYSKFSEEVIEALTQLYSWLKTQHPGEVQCAMDLKIKGWSRPADMAVPLADGRISAYWVFDRTPKNWLALKNGTAPHVSRHVLYTLSAHNLTQTKNQLILAAGQRGLMGKSTFNETADKWHLCFLDTEQHNVVLYRDLSCDHEPNLFSWQHIHKVPWSQCRLFPGTGEIVADHESEHGLPLD